MGDKPTTIEALRAELGRWEALLAGMGEAQITAPLPGSDWSLKDTIAHLRAWQQRSVARLEAAAAGGEPAFPEWPASFDPEEEGQPHDLNAWLYEAARARPWAQVHAEWRAGFERLLELAEAVPEADLLAPGRYPWLEGHSLALILDASREHHDEHMGIVLAALGGRDA